MKSLVTWQIMFSFGEGVAVMILPRVPIWHGSPTLSTEIIAQVIQRVVRLASL